MRWSHSARGAAHERSCCETQCTLCTFVLFLVHSQGSLTFVFSEKNHDNEGSCNNNGPVTECKGPFKMSSLKSGGLTAVLLLFPVTFLALTVFLCQCRRKEEILWVNIAISILIKTLLVFLSDDTFITKTQTGKEYF